MWVENRPFNETNDRDLRFREENDKDMRFKEENGKKNDEKR